MNITEHLFAQGDNEQHGSCWWKEILWHIVKFAVTNMTRLS